MSLSYAVITPARDEETNLPRLGACLAAQTIRPRQWLIVENGSSDATPAVAQDLADEHPWVHVLAVPGTESANRGAPVVQALHAGIGALTDPPDVVVNVDADISMDPDHFGRLLARFEADPKLGIASGTLFELSNGSWQPRHLTGTTVVGGCRAYRWDCLRVILPLEERVGWDGIDEFNANARGWTTRSFQSPPFRHHRREGERDGGTWYARWNQGHAAWYVGYRFWYLVLRALWHMRREPAALAMALGYASAGLKREPRNSDVRARDYLRSQQSLRNLRSRALEASGRRQAS
jgi:glycosyltransferase involved in cell wall biosynthesis